MNPDSEPWRLAQRTVGEVLAALPEDLRAGAEQCPVRLELMGDGPEADAELLGLFEGASLLEPLPECADDLPRITLYLDNLWAFAEEDSETFADEVEVTLLHELGHFLGLDEDEVAARGLE